jgi:hypothetical protein
MADAVESRYRRSFIASDVSTDQKITLWGLGGFALDDGIYDISSHLYLCGIGATKPYFWNGYGEPDYDSYQQKYPGFQVRCVRALLLQSDGINRQFLSQSDGING